MSGSAESHMAFEFAMVCKTVTYTGKVLLCMHLHMNIFVTLLRSDNLNEF